MDVGPLIKTILEAPGPLSIFQSLDTIEKDYRWMTKLLHPDVCPHADAARALSKISGFRKGLKNGFDHLDDAGAVVYNQGYILFKGDPQAIKTSFQRYASLMNLRGKDAEFFQGYLPTGCVLEGVQLKLNIPTRAVPISSLGEMEPRHVYWIVSRMLELASWFWQVDMVHGGFNPNTIYVRPKDHGIICPTFYHMVGAHSRMKTISSEFSNWYPPELLKDKKAIDGLDAHLIKKIGIYLLGDPSGIGNKLRGRYGPWVMDFFTAPFESNEVIYRKFRKLLEEHTDTTKFHELKV